MKGTGEKALRMKRTQSGELGLVPRNHVRGLTTLMCSSDWGHPRAHRTCSCTRSNKKNNKILFSERMRRRFVRCHLGRSEQSVCGNANWRIVCFPWSVKRKLSPFFNHEVNETHRLAGRNKIKPHLETAVPAIKWHLMWRILKGWVSPSGIRDAKLQASKLCRHNRFESFGV